MKSIKIPYHKTYKEVQISEKDVAGILESEVNQYRTDLNEIQLINRALDNPISSSKLEDLVKGKESILIITSDHTRPVPSRLTMPLLLERIRKGNPSIDIKILIATGYHRESTREELIDKFGQQIVDREKIYMHRSRDKESLINIGTLPSGGELWVNKMVRESDLVIAEGFIEPHFFAGFSGGRKSILPGVAGAETVLANHCSEFIDSPYARTGILEKNPIHKDMLYAATKANLAFILNVVLNEDKKVINAFAGHMEDAHKRGCEFLMDIASVKKVEADIVITGNGGYPLDQNVYQSVKGMTAGEAVCKKGGVIIMISACNDGHGGKSFYENLAKASGPDEVLEKVLKIPRDKTIPDQWEFQILARILKHHNVIMVTDMCDPQMIEDMHMKCVKDINQALKIAKDIVGDDSKIVVIPDGVSVIVR